ncbi:MAG: hypothetical protein ACRCVA_00815, partial [Phreatobacter sp.]
IAILQRIAQIDVLDAVFAATGRQDTFAHVRASRIGGWSDPLNRRPRQGEQAMNLRPSQLAGGLRGNSDPGPKTAVDPALPRQDDTSPCRPLFTVSPQPHCSWQGTVEPTVKEVNP